MPDIPPIPGNSSFDDKLNALGMKLPNSPLGESVDLSPKDKSDRVLASLKNTVFNSPQDYSTANVKPFSLNISTTPSTNGASGPTIVKSIELSFAQRANCL